MYENDPERPIKELLDQIRSSSMQPTSATKSNVAMALPTFSALLVRLSNEASKTADKNLQISNDNLQMQEKMLKITIIILAFAALTFVAQVLNLFGIFSFYSKKG